MPKRENNDRKFPGANGPRPDNYKMKVAEGKERQEHYDTLSVEKKIEMLDIRLGKDQGAKKQRAQFAALLEKKNTVEVKQEVVSEVSTNVSSEKKNVKAKDRRKQERNA